MKHFNIIFTLCLALSYLSFKASAQNLETTIDSLLNAEYKDRNGPGGVFMIAKGGKPMYRKAFGKANLELNVAMTPEHIFQIGSITKQFTAIAILMLEEQGKLKVKDPISKYVADYPQGDKITIHHLLSHTSGIKDFTKMKSLKDIAQKEMTPKMMVDFFKNEPADFAPGEKFDYNNSGYVLLGYLIEVVAGMTYEDFIKQNIFRKVGMKQSQYASDRQIIQGRAYGYQMKDSNYVNKTSISFSVPFSSGSLMATADDMLKWQNALTQNILLRPENTLKAFTKNTLNNGTEITYGYGWHIRDIQGVPTWEHGGSIFGFKTMGVYLPSKDVYVIGLSNCDCHSPTQLIKDIAAVALRTFEKQK